MEILVCWMTDKGARDLKKKFLFNKSVAMILYAKLVSPTPRIPHCSEYCIIAVNSDTNGFKWMVLTLM